MSPSASVHVAVGVIRNAKGEVLIALRSPQSHQGGLWEFPGGKLEAGENAFGALGRELKEELGLQLQSAHPLIKITHQYPDRSVLLDVWSVSHFEGVPSGREGQPVKWVPISALHKENFPPANAPIINTLQLPGEIAITRTAKSRNELMAILGALIKKGLPAIQLRQKQLSAAEYADWFHAATRLCQRHQVLLFANASPELSGELNAVAVHLTSRILMQQNQCPVADGVLLSAACHNAEQLAHAEALGVHLAMLSPVSTTAKVHDTGQVLGWDGFQALSDQVSLPVYALGGLRRNELGLARRFGAHGIAGIRAFDSAAVGD